MDKCQLAAMAFMLAAIFITFGYIRLQKTKKVYQRLIIDLGRTKQNYEDKIKQIANSDKAVFGGSAHVESPPTDNLK